jgi:long-chain fatty acid transport protein
MYSRVRRGLVLGTGVLGATLFLCPSKADASGYLVARFGGDQGSPALANPYAVYYNPAAMGGTQRTSLTLDVTGILRSASYDRPTLVDIGKVRSPEDIASNTGRASLSNFIPLPYFSVTSNLGTKSFRIGYAAYVPFGGTSKWDQTSNFPTVPGGIDGPQRWHSIHGSLLAINNTVAASYTFQTIGLSLGASVSGIYHKAQSLRARNLVGNDDTSIEGRSLVDAKGFNVGMAFGLYWEDQHLWVTDLRGKQVPRLRMGLSYTSQPGFGTTRMSGTLDTAFAGGKPASKEVDVLQDYPDIVRAGVAYRVLPSLDIRGDFEFVRWSTFKSQCVVMRGANCDVNDDGSSGKDAAGNEVVVVNVFRRMQDSAGFRLGANWEFRRGTELFGGGMVTTSAISKQYIDAGLIDSTRIYGTLGIRHQFSDHFTFGISYNHIYFVPVTTTESKASTFIGASANPDANGTYKSQWMMLNANGTVTF